MSGKTWPLAVALVPLYHHAATASPPPAPTRRAEPCYELRTAFSYETLSNGYADWRSAEVQVKRPLGDRAAIYGGWRSTERFSLKDHELMAGTGRPLGRRWTDLVEATLSPSPCSAVMVRAGAGAAYAFRWVGPPGGPAAQ